VLGSSTAGQRPQARGKFFFTGEEKFYVRGVTYGTFMPRQGSGDYPPVDVVERDFETMAENGVNTVRTYTVPPAWLMDAAHRHGLRVLVGIAWPEHQLFMETRAQRAAVEEEVRRAARTYSDHPALFGLAIGNEIPTSLVRWYGPRRVETFLERLYRIAKIEAPEAPVTYVNFPSTEYLDLPFLDWVGFNVYLESESQLAAYLPRLQNLAGERPLMITELGLDSRRNGEDAQALSLASQLRTVFAAGCAGAFAYAWTDEWYRGGDAIEDWDFGVTTREREPKPSLRALRSAFEDVPFCSGYQWPRVSVVVCTYNGARTIEDCLTGISKLKYPNFETIVVNDGSTDAAPDIASRFDVRLISTENRGLSSARNTGLAAATGDIVAYIDDDARPDPHWLSYLAWTFETTDHAGVGGPNFAPAGDGLIADCVANSPGGPMEVLISDSVAEHIPGCNMAFRREALVSIGGFDPLYRTAGDDVDVCWRLLDAGGTLGFHAGALVWHHRRNSVGTYWRQQVGYGRAEALLEEKWPERYNAAGHLSWAGRIYGRGLAGLLGRVQRVYHGTWGSAPFQRMYEAPGAGFLSWSAMPEWILVILAFALLTFAGVFWTPLLVFALPGLGVSMLMSLCQAYAGARKAVFRDKTTDQGIWKLKALTFALHLMQPAARLRGRTRFGLTPWRRRIATAGTWPRRWTHDFWTGDWRAPEEELNSRETFLRSVGATVRRGGPHDRWDLETSDGFLTATRLQIAVEEHGSGVQHWLVRYRPRLSGVAVVLVAVGAGLLALSLASGSWPGVAVAVTALALVLRKGGLEATAIAGALWACELSAGEVEVTRREGVTSGAR
jgi:glycosyltransferase involved in cell wall biosynthesis